jgi:hypothetical protein
MEKTLLDVSARLLELNRRVVDLEEKNENLCTQVGALKAENTALRAKPTAEPSVSSPSEALRNETASNDFLRLEVAGLKARIAELEAAVNPVKKNERHYQQLLEKRLGGKHLYLPGVGTTDITTDDSHVEVKIWEDYHIVPGQLAKYQRAAPRKRKCVYFFGRTPKSRRLTDIAEIMADAGIEMYMFDSDDIPYKHNMAPDFLLPFVSECLVESRADNLPWMDLLEAFRCWEKKERETEPPLKSQALKDGLKRHNVLYVRTTVNNNHFYGVKGFSLRARPADQEETSQ